MTPSSHFESELLEVHGTGSWLDATSHLTRRRALYTREAESEQTIRLRSSPSEFRLLLLTHDWSGICTVEAAGSLSRIDLYCDDAAGRVLEVSIPGTGTGTEIRLGSTEERNARAAESQVWLLGFKCDGQFVPIERGQVAWDGITDLEWDILAVPDH